jgi:WD40 repeat protein
VRLWDTQDWEIQGTLFGHRGAVSSVVFIREEGSDLISGSIDGLRVWNSSRRVHVRQLVREKGVLSLSASARENRFWTGHLDGTVTEFKSDSFAPAINFRANESNKPVLALACQAKPDVIAAGFVGGVSFFGADREIIYSYKTTESDAECRSVLFASTNQAMAGICHRDDSNSICVLDSANRKVLDQLVTEYRPLSMAISSEYFAVGGSDGRLRIWSRQ